MSWPRHPPVPPKGMPPSSVLCAFAFNLMQKKNPKQQQHLDRHLAPIIGAAFISLRAPHRTFTRPRAFKAITRVLARGFPVWIRRLPTTGPRTNSPCPSRPACDTDCPLLGVWEKILDMRKPICMRHCRNRHRMRHGCWEAIWSTFCSVFKNWKMTNCHANPSLLPRPRTTVTCTLFRRTILQRKRPWCSLWIMST